MSLDELAQEQDLMKAKGINPTPNQPPAAAPPTPPDQAPEVLAAKAQADGMVRAAEATAKARAAEPAPAPAAGPQINVTLDTTELAIGNGFAKAAAPLMQKLEQTAADLLAREMINNIYVPEAPAPNVTVNVAAPNVTLEATVPEAQVVVNNTHPARAVQTVERNSFDEIVRTVTTYES
jgi:hypothetical protein